MMKRRSFLLASTCSVLSVMRSHANERRLVKLVIPYAAGANSDVFTRALAQQVTAQGGPQFVVENRPGGGGTIAAMAVKQASPDGLTLLVANVGSHAILPAIQPLSYDPFQDFVAVTQLFYFPNFLILPTRIPAQNLAELMDWAVQQPKGLSFGSQGVGSPGHLLGAMLMRHSAARMVHVPYAAGGGPMNMDLIAGRLDTVFSTYASMRSHAEQGKVRFLAVASAHRSSLLPQVPTLAEAGMPDVELDSWFGLLAPYGTPLPVVEHLSDMFAMAAQSPQIQQLFATQGVTLQVDGSQALAQRMHRDHQRFARLGQQVHLNR